MIYSIMHQDTLTDKDADEIIFDVTKDTNIFSLRTYIMESLQGKRIVFYVKHFEPNIQAEEWVNLLAVAADLKKTVDIAICLDLIPENVYVGLFLKNNEIPYFYHYICNTKMHLMRMCLYGVSDIYIGGELGFSLKDIQLLKNQYRLRVIPDRPITSELEKLVNPLKTFWIIPQSLDIYEPYIDVLEIYARPKVKLKIYKEKKWDGKISDLIPETYCDVFSNTIPPAFGFYRLNCGLHCAYGSCHICQEAINFAQELSKRDLEIRKVEKK